MPMPLIAFLIEDDPVIQENLTLLMSQVLDARVMGCAQTTDEALSWLAMHEEHSDLIVLDLFLKEGTGFTVLKCMSPEHRRHCVVLTNADTPADIALCFDLGAAAVFDKTLQMDEFLKYCALLPTTKSFPRHGRTAGAAHLLIRHAESHG
jgi:DNA-binding NarL/FixJ family response regulator